MLTIELELEETLRDSDAPSIWNEEWEEPEHLWVLEKPDGKLGVFEGYGCQCHGHVVPMGAKVVLCYLHEEHALGLLSHRSKSGKPAIFQVVQKRFEEVRDYAIDEGLDGLLIHENHADFWMHWVSERVEIPDWLPAA